MTKHKQNANDPIRRLIGDLARNVTEHGACRGDQRNLSEAGLIYVLLHGAKVRRTGAIFVVLRRRDIPAEDRHIDQWAKLEGTVAIVSLDGTLITVYRNRDAFRDIRKKPKQNLKRPRLSVSPKPIDFDPVWRDDPGEALAHAA
jgi:hypothetical protein